MKHHTLLFLTVFFTIQFNTAVAQNILSGTVQGLLKNTPVYLSEFYGGKAFPSDTVYSDIYGAFDFDLSNKATGMLQLNYLNQTHLFIYNNESIGFTTFLQAPVDSLHITVSKENKLYYNYLTEKSQSEKILQLLYPLVNSYPATDTLYPAILQRFRQAEAARENILATLTQDTTLLATRIIQWEQLPQPDAGISQFENIAFYREHLLDNIDFSSPYLLRTNILSGLYAMYLSFYTTANTAEQIKTDYKTATTNLLKYTEQNKEVYLFTVNFLINEMERYGHPDIAEYVLAQAELNDQACTDEKSRLLEDHLLKLRRTAIGQIAPDISAPTADSVMVRLSDVEAPYKLVVFWASWCPHCTALLPQLEETYNKYHRNGLEIITISLDTDTRAWQNELKGNRRQWVNLCPQKGWESTAAQEFGIYATPTMFLLDHNNQIIAKPATANSEQLAVIRQ